MSGQKVLISNVNAGKWFRFFQVLDCSAAVQGKVKLAPPRSEGYCSGRRLYVPRLLCRGHLRTSAFLRRFSHFEPLAGSRTSMCQRVDVLPLMWYNVLVEVRVEISGAPLLFAKTRAALFISTKNAEFAFLMLDFAENLQNGRVDFNFRLNCGQFFNS